METKTTNVQSLGRDHKVCVYKEIIYANDFSHREATISQQQAAGDHKRKSNNRESNYFTGILSLESVPASSIT